MSFYDFECNTCGTTKEDVWIPLSEEKTIDCPSCNDVMQRVYSLVGVNFVGSGFHCNDYKGK